MNENTIRRGRRRQGGLAGGGPFVAILLVATALAIASASPAAAVAGGPAGATSDNSPAPAINVADPLGRPDPTALDLGLLAAVAGPALVAGCLLACRPRISRHRAIRRIRAQLATADVNSICGQAPTFAPPGTLHRGPLARPASWPHHPSHGPARSDDLAHRSALN